LVNYNDCSLNDNYTLPHINNDNKLTEVTKYNNIITGNKVWLCKVNNGLHKWFDVDPWGDNYFWAS